MENKDLIIIALLGLAIYLYYQNIKLRKLPAERVFVGTDNSTSPTLLNLLNVNNLAELQTKLGEKSLNELLEENEDYETEVDTLTRTKESLEQDLSAQATAFQNRLREKDREIKKFKEDLGSLEKRLEKVSGNLGSEKQQHKGSIARITKLTEQITNIQKEQQDQLRKINILFDEQAKDYEVIDFSGLYSLLEQQAPKLKKIPGEFPKEEVE